MRSVDFSTGAKEYEFNGDPDNRIKINVADPNLIGRIEKAVSRLDSIQEKFSGEASFDIMIEADREIRDVLANVFGCDICSAAFGDANCFSLVDGETPLIVSFLEAFLPVIKADIEAAIPKKAPEQKLRPEVQKYIGEPVKTPTVKPVAGLSQPYGINVNTLTKEQRAALIAQLLA